MALTDPAAQGPASRRTSVPDPSHKNPLPAEASSASQSNNQAALSPAPRPPSQKTSTSKEPKSPKKTNSVLRLLTLKEPSQSALEQFAQQQRKQAAGKGKGKGPAQSASVFETVSAQKLPATVPKVNSKWDGMPEAMKSKGGPAKKRNFLKKKKSTATQPASPLSPSTAPSSSLLSPRSGISSLSHASTNISSPISDGKVSGPPGWEKYLSDSQVSSPSSATLPEMTYFFPDNPHPSGALGDAAKHPSPTEKSPAVPATTLPSLKSGTMDGSSRSMATAASVLSDSPSVEVPHPTQKAPKGASPEAVTPKEPKPLHPATLEQPLDDSDSNSDDSHSDANTHSFLSELQKTTYESSHHAHTPKPTSPSPRRNPINFSRPFTNPSLPLSQRHSISGRPTLHETPTATKSTSDRDSMNTNTDTTIIPSPPQPDQVNLDAPQRTPSATPSEISASYHQSPRERLGLGSRIRRSVGSSPPDNKDSNEGELKQPGKRKRRSISCRLSLFGRGGGR